jgi:hypothetical protein
MAWYGWVAAAVAFLLFTVVVGASAHADAERMRAASAALEEAKGDA